jgi:hypothetical protein
MSRALQESDRNMGRQGEDDMNLINVSPTVTFVCQTPSCIMLSVKCIILKTIQPPLTKNSVTAPQTESSSLFSSSITFSLHNSCIVAAHPVLSSHRLRTQHIHSSQHNATLVLQSVAVGLRSVAAPGVKNRR